MMRFRAVPVVFHLDSSAFSILAGRSDDTRWLLLGGHERIIVNSRCNENFPTNKMAGVQSELSVFLSKTLQVVDVRQQISR